MTFLAIPENKGKKTATISVNGSFIKKIFPGDRMNIRAELNSNMRGVAKGHSIGHVNGEIACQAEFMVAIPGIVEGFRPKLNRD